ncbi:MAG: RDD family protein, partial [Arcobacter sp.]|nr:RDD family protein [Arcobacter sp.]
PSTKNTSAQNNLTKICPSCKNITVPDKLFCIWCETYIPNIKVGKKAEFIRRMSATALDPFLILMLCSIIKVNVVCSIVVILYQVFFFWLLSKGMTPGKLILGENVVDKLSGDYPGYWRMVLREVISKFVSVLAFGLGYPWLWAVWDKNNQMWHDKIAGTVVVNTH